MKKTSISLFSLIAAFAGLIPTNADTPAAAPAAPNKSATVANNSYGQRTAAPRAGTSGRQGFRGPSQTGGFVSPDEERRAAAAAAAAEPIVGIWKCVKYTHGYPSLDGQDESQVKPNTLNIVFLPNGGIAGSVDFDAQMNLILLSWEKTAQPRVYKIKTNQQISLPDRFYSGYMLARVDKGGKLVLLRGDSFLRDPQVEGILQMLEKGYALENILESADSISFSFERRITLKSDKKADAPVKKVSPEAVINPNDPVIGLWKNKEVKGQPYANWNLPFLADGSVGDVGVLGHSAAVTTWQPSILPNVYVVEKKNNSYSPLFLATIDKDKNLIIGGTPFSRPLLNAALQILKDGHNFEEALRLNHGYFNHYKFTKVTTPTPTSSPAPAATQKSTPPNDTPKHASTSVIKRL